MCLLVGLFVCALLLLLLCLFGACGSVYVFFLGAVPPNFRHGGGPGAARAYDIIDCFER